MNQYETLKRFAEERAKQRKTAGDEFLNNIGLAGSLKLEKFNQSEHPEDMVTITLFDEIYLENSIRKLRSELSDEDLAYAMQHGVRVVIDPDFFLERIPKNV